MDRDHIAAHDGKLPIAVVEDQRSGIEIVMNGRTAPGTPRKTDEPGANRRSQDCSSDSRT
jgi:hypothetical protein